MCIRDSPKAIAAAKNKAQAGYPKCLLCPENEGYAGLSLIHILLSVGVTAKMIRLQLLLECALVALAAFLIAGLAAGPLTAALGNAAARAVGPSGGAQPFSVSIEPGTSKIQVFKTCLLYTSRCV